MAHFEACKSSGLITGDAEVCSNDAYYVGIVLTYDSDVVVTVTDGEGNVIDTIDLTVGLHGNSRAQNVPIPVLAPGGINVSSDAQDGGPSWIVYYAEQYFTGHRHV